jgi:hypothetical protein
MRGETRSAVVLHAPPPAALRTLECTLAESSVDGKRLYLPNHFTKLFLGQTLVITKVFNLIHPSRGYEKVIENNMACCFNTARECLTVTIEAFNTLLSLRVSNRAPRTTQSYNNGRCYGIQSSAL